MLGAQLDEDVFDGLKIAIRPTVIDPDVSGGNEAWLFRQCQNLKDAFMIREQRPFTETIARGDILVDVHVEELTNTRVIIKTHAIAISDGDEKIVQQQLFLRQAAQKAAMQEVMIHPAKGAVADVSDAVRN